MGAEARFKFTFSEKTMVEAFLKCAESQHGLPGLGKFWKVFCEVKCHRGRPDLLAIPPCQEANLKTNSGWGYNLASSTVLALLETDRSRTLDYLVNRSGLSRRSVSSALQGLLEGEYISLSRRNSFRLASAATLFEVETWAFEFKLDKPKRAIFQAQQYRAFARRVMIVVPPPTIEKFHNFKDTLRRWGIGLAAFDPLTGHFQIVQKAKSNSPTSRQHQIYAVARVLEQLKAA